MGKETELTEFRITTINGTVLYEGFERIMAVKSFARIDAQNQYERRGNDDWKCKFYKPIK
jgi:hypothetical protein